MPTMGYFEPTFHPHPHYHHEQMHSHYTEEPQSYTMATQSSPMIPVPNPPTKTNETKPRLGKDEVDILEREFQKNPKPTTQTKRQFAEDMGVDLARINNWFQNRRAKRKQEKKQEAYEAGQAQETLTYSEPSSPDTFANSSGYFSAPSAPFPMAGPPQPAASYNPQYTDPSSASMESLNRTFAAAQAAHSHAPEPEEYEFVEQHASLHTFGAEHVHDFVTSDRAEFPVPEEAFLAFENGQSFPYPTGFATDMYHATQSVSEGHSSPEDTTHQTPTPYNSYPAPSGPEITILQPLTTTFPSQLLLAHSNDCLPALSADSGCSSQSPEDSTQSYTMALNTEITSSPPAPSIPFKSPPPMDIASRRKKVQHKPAALSAATMSSRPPMGPRTVSHAESFRRLSDSPSSSPMRRVISAGGSRPVLSGRIQKSGVEAAQRSPINLGGFESAGSFIERNYNSFRNPPSLTGSSSLSSSLAPPTPMSPRERQMTLVKRETTRSAQTTASPEEGHVNFVFNAGVPGCFTTVDPEIASPPETPQAHLPMQPAYSTWTDGSEFNEKQWQFEVPDEPLYTPGIHDSFPMEIQMPRPSYLTSVSQPVTPAFGPPFNAGFMFGHESPHFKNESPQFKHESPQFKHESPFFTHHPSGSEYSFPETNPFTTGMSPNMTKQKTFQFSHTTPADFSEK